MALTDINLLAEAVLKRLRPIARQRDIELTLVRRREVHAEVDATRISLALTNLVENAIKYNRDHGEVEVTVDADDRYFQMTVRDNGIGIPEEAQGRIYERFYRVDKSRSREIGGTGLGLSITKSAILRHHGTVTVESKEGEGTTFTVQIPLRYSAEPIELRPGRPRRQLSRLLRFRGHADRQKDYEEKTILVSRRKVNPEEAHYSQKTLYPDKQDPQKKTPGPEDRTDGSGHSSAYTSGVKADGTERRDTNA